MIATSGSLIFLAVSVFIASSFLLNSNDSSRVQAYEDVEPLEAKDSLLRLPELFSDDKLVRKPNNTNLCLRHLGCIRKFINYHPPIEPLEMNAAFNLATKNEQVYIRYNETRNCLKGANKCEIYPFDLSLIRESSFNPKDRTFILIGGWNSKEPNQDLQRIKDLWLSINESVNIIEAHWSGGSNKVYWKAVSSTKVFARQLVAFIYYLGQIKGGYELSNQNFTGRFNFVGHSLGAHISGFVAKDIGGQVGLITALDPALPSFENVEPEFTLHRTDAKLVQILHTNGGLYGQANPIGDLDFYANDGTKQPGCDMDRVTACSHKRVNALYLQFLQNEIYLKHFLAIMDKKYHINHRLFSYPSENFVQFQNGSTFVENCQSIAYSKYSSQNDIGQCIVPVDFVSDASQQLHRLKTRYNVDITSEKDKKSTRKLYFYTAKDSPYLNNHHLLKIRVYKYPQVPARCDVSIKLRMSGGATTELAIKDYNFIRIGNYIEMIVPFLSMNMKSKYELAGLDAQQFYRENITKLEQSLVSIFPSTIIIKGYKVGHLRDEKSLSNSLMSFFGLAEEKPNQASGCNLNVSSLTIQPIKKLSRLLLATYEPDVQPKAHPDLTFLLESNTAGWEPKTQDDKRKTAQPLGSVFYFSNALIGSYEEDTSGEELDQNLPVELIEQIPQEYIDEKPETSTIPKAQWVILTMLTIALIVGFVYWQQTTKPFAVDQVLLIRSVS